MTTLMIKDLALTEELSSKAMAAVHGGRSLRSPFSFDVDVRTINVHDVIQSSHQDQSISNAAGVNVGLVDENKAKGTVDAKQYATNNFFVG